MPNQANFRSDVTNNTEIRFTASRIVRAPSETLFYEELPASFGFDREDNVEIHFYTIPGNQLILSTLAKINDEVLKLHIVSYEDNTYKNYLRLDFTKLFADKNLILIPGDYRVVFNIFSDEIGDYQNRKLNIDKISDSRTEVQLSFNNTVDTVTLSENIYLLDEFMQKSFNKADSIVAGKQIFASSVEEVNQRLGVTADTVIDSINIENTRQTYDSTIKIVERLGLLPTFKQQINEFIPVLSQFLTEQIVISGDDRIQESQYQDYIYDIVKQQITKLQGVVDSRIKIT